VVSAAYPLRPYSRISRQEQLLFLPSSSSIVLTRLSGPRPRSDDIFTHRTLVTRVYMKRILIKYLDVDAGWAAGPSDLGGEEEILSPCWKT
jgi:hypothetical protein